MIAAAAAFDRHVPCGTEKLCFGASHGESKCPHHLFGRVFDPADDENENQMKERNELFVKRDRTTSIPPARNGTKKQATNVSDGLVAGVYSPWPWSKRLRSWCSRERRF